MYFPPCKRDILKHCIHSLKLSQPGVGHNGPKDGCQVAESHKDVIDGGGEVIVPVQEVGKVQHEDSCGQAAETNTSVISLYIINIDCKVAVLKLSCEISKLNVKMFSPRMP